MSFGLIVLLVILLFPVLLQQLPDMMDSYRKKRP